MDEEYIKAIHAAYGEDKLGSYDDFYSEITSNKDYRDLVYNQLGGADVFGEYADFEDLVSIKQEDTQKKKTTQPYQPTSEEPTEVSKIPSESIDLGVYPTAFTPKEDIEKVSEAGGISDEKLKRKASEIALESTSTLRKQQKELENQIKGYQEVFNNSKTRLEDIQLEFDELNENLSNKYGLYYDAEQNAYNIPKIMQPQFNQDVSVLNQLQKDFEEVQQGIKDNANAYRNSANRYAINKEALAQRGTPIGTFMTNLISEGVPTIVGGLGAAAVDLTSYTRPDLLAMRMAGGGAEQYVRLGAEELRGKVDKVQDEMSNLLYDKIGVHLGSTKEYIEQQTEEGDFWNIAAGGLGTSIPAMLTAGLTGGASFYAQMYDFGDEAVKDVEGLSEGEKVAYKTTVAAITGALEKYGFSSLLKNKSITNSVVGRVLKRLPSIAKGKSANVSDDFINIVLDEGRIANATLNSAKQRGIDYGGRIVTGFLAEAETGGLQSLAENSIEQSINLLKGEEVFDSKDWYDFTKEFLFDAAAEGAGGAAISGTIGLFSRKGATQKQFDAAAKYLGDIRLEAIGAALEADVEAGNMTKEQAKATYDKIKQYKEDLARLPEDFPDSKKGEAVSLIQKRNGLQEKLGKVDESFKPKVQQEIDNINAKLAEMGSVSDADIAAKEAESAENTVRTFAERIAKGEDVSSAEDIQFYENNKQEVEDALRQMQEAEEVVTETVEEQPTEMEGEAVVETLKNVDNTAIALDKADEKIKVETQEDGSVRLVNGSIDIRALLNEQNKKNNIESPSKIDWLPNTLKLFHVTKYADKIIKEKSFANRERNVDTPIDGVYFTDDTRWSSTKEGEESRFGTGKTKLSVDINNDGLVYFDDLISFEEFLKKNGIPSDGRSLEKKDLEPLISKGVKGILLKVDFASQTGNELIVLDESIIKNIKKASDSDVYTELPKSFFNVPSIVLAEAYHKAKADGSNPELVKAVEELLTKQEETDAVQEQATGEVPVQPKAEVSGEMEEGVPDTEPQEATQEGKKPRVAKDKKGITSLMERVFGLNKSKSKAAARIYDIAIGTIAERAGITKEEAYRMIGLLKGKKEQLKGKGNVLFQSLSSSVWESTAKRGIEAIKQNAATPEQWVKMISDKGGKGTSQELEWIGLQDFLTDYAKENNLKSVPKEVVEQYIDDNQIEIVEVAKSKDWGKSFEEIRDELDAVDEKLRNEGITARGVSASRRVIDNGKGSKYYNDVLKRLNDKTKKKFDELIDKKFNEEPKFTGYALEGGENYREVLLTLPNNKKSDQKFYKKEHFDEANILAHLRLNERTLPNGERVLFIEEVQSDWAQEGKKKGFASDLFRGNFRAFVEQEKGLRLNEEQLLAEFNNNEGELKQEFLKRTDKTKTPDMPYKKTDQWVGMAMRRVFKMAADEGFNRVAWVTGEQSAERYDLSKQVDTVGYNGKKDGTYDVVVKDFGGRDLLNKNMTIDEIESTLGKEVANKIQSNEHGDDISTTDAVERQIWEENGYVTEGVLEGENLKVGGEGMKAFYNSILPKVAKKEAQRFDKNANVEVVDFSKNPLRVVERDGKRILISNENGEVIDSQYGDRFKTDEEYIEAFIDAYQNSKGTTVSDKGVGKQLSIAITPEMRMNLNSAIPLFQGEQGAMVVAEDGNYIIYALTDPNVSTPLHELAHVYEHYLTEQERADIEAWSGHKSGTVEFSEAFARGFEKYLADGKAPNDKLQKLFDNFKKWLTEIYDGITGSEIDLELNDKMRGIYDAMLGGETTPENIRVAQTKVQLPSIKTAMPFLDGFDITKLTEDQINLLNEVMETYLETGELVGDGTLRAIVEGIQGAESNGPNAKMTADSLDIGAGEYLNLIAAIMGRAKNAWIRLQRELGLTGENGLTIGLTKASAFRNNFYEIIERATGNKVYEKGTESRVQVVGIVLQRIGQMVGNRNTVEQVINDVLDDFQKTAEYLKVYGDPSLGDYASNIEKAVAKVRGATTADEVLSKLTPKEKEVLEVYYEANNVGIDEKIEVSKANGRPLKVIPNYLHIPIRSKTVVEPQNSTPTNNTLSNPAQINISNAFAPQTVSTKSTGAQKSRVANAHKLPEGSYYDPMFFSAQAKSFNNTNVAIFTYQAIQKMNAFLSTGEAVERFGGGKRGRSNIEAFQKSVNQALNAESLSAKASAELREFKVSGVKVGEALNTFQRIAKKKAIVWVMARPAQFFLQAPVFINTIGHVLMSPLMLKNPIAAMAVLQRAIVFQTQTWTKEKGWQNRRGLPWADLIKLAPAGIRDIRESFAFMEGDSEDVISRRSGITNKAIKVYDKADDYALKYSVAVTDRAAAQMSWLSLYETYMLEKGLVEGADLTNRESYNEWWKSQGQNPNYDAIAYADTMVAKDQNASANFQRAILQTDKSAFEKLFRSLVFPLINFKINKIQSIRSESKIISTINKKVTAEDRLSAGGRLLFTAAEMAVYHQASIFFVGAWKELVDLMWKSGIDYITGDDDDDEIFDEDDMGKTIKNQKRFWTRWITESSPLLSTLNIDQRMQNGMAEAYNFMCYQFNKQTDTAFASQYPEYESYARSGEAPAKVEFIDEGIGNAGYLGIVAEQVMTIDEMWEAAMNGERENQYGEMVYYTPEQQKSLKFTATLATINAIMPSHPLTAEVFGMVNRSFYKENNKAYDNMLARDLETIGKGIPEEDAIAIMNSYIQTTYKDLFEQEGITALTAIGESLKRDIGNVVKREVLKESFKSLYNSEDAKINEFLVRASRGGSPRDKANKIFARIKALDKMGETEKRDKLAYEAYVLSLKGITVGQDQGLSIVLLLDAYNYNKNVLGGKSFLELSTEMSKKYGGGGNNEK